MVNDPVQIVVGPKGEVRLQGVVLRAGERTPAGHVYPRETIEQIAQQLGERATYLYAPGAFDDPRPTLRMVAGEVERVVVAEDGSLDVSAKILDTPEGQKLKSHVRVLAGLQEAGIRETSKLGFSISAVGRVAEDGTVSDVAGAQITVMDESRIGRIKGPYR